jgi:hypothetical protein
MELKIGKWNDISPNLISLENIRLVYQSENDYRISWNKYEGNTKFDGFHYQGRIYVISGYCALVINGYRYFVQEHTFIDFPNGYYSFSVPNETGVEIVTVWEIPTEFIVNQE